MKSYIGKIEAEWVDPAVELPPDGWQGVATWGWRKRTGDPMQRIDIVSGYVSADGGWIRGLGASEDRPFRWLRIGGPVTP